MLINKDQAFKAEVKAKDLAFKAKAEARTFCCNPVDLQNYGTFALKNFAPGSETSIMELSFPGAVRCC